MTSRLIINADDFGLTRGVNQAIEELSRAKVLSSATIMASGKAVSHATTIASRLPELGVGCHVVLVDGDPTCAPEEIPTLIGADHKRLQQSLSAFSRMALLGRLDESEIEREAGAQISRLREFGITLSHLDSHKHVHMFPAVLRPLLRVAERFGIPAIRNPFEQAWSRKLGHGSLLRRSQLRLLGLLERSFHEQVRRYEGRIRTTDGAIGVFATGSLNAESLTSLLQKLPTGTWEFVCHPGFCDQDLRGVTTRLQGQREVERKALLEVVRHATEGRIELISFLALQAGDQ